MENLCIESSALFILILIKHLLGIFFVLSHGNTAVHKADTRGSYIMNVNITKWVAKILSKCLHLNPQNSGKNLERR